MLAFKKMNLIYLVMLHLLGLSRYFGRTAQAVLTWLFVILTATTSPLAQNLMTGMRIGAVTVDESPGFRLVVETLLPLQAQLSLLVDPYRLVIDMPDASWQVNGLPQRGDLGMGLASAYRFGSPKPMGVW